MLQLDVEVNCGAVTKRRHLSKGMCKQTCHRIMQNYSQLLTQGSIRTTNSLPSNYGVIVSRPGHQRRSWFHPLLLSEAQHSTAVEASRLVSAARQSSQPRATAPTAELAKDMGDMVWSNAMEGNIYTNIYQTKHVQCIYIYQKYTKVLLHFVAGQLLLCGKVMHLC